MNTYVHIYAHICVCLGVIYWLLLQAGVLLAYLLLGLFFFPLPHPPDMITWQFWFNLYSVVLSFWLCKYCSLPNEIECCDYIFFLREAVQSLIGCLNPILAPQANLSIFSLLNNGDINSTNLLRWYLQLNELICVKWLRTLSHMMEVVNKILKKQWLLLPFFFILELKLPHWHFFFISFNLLVFWHPSTIT